MIPKLESLRAHQAELEQEAKKLRLQSILVKSFGDMLARLAARPDLTAEDVEMLAQHMINQLAKHPEALSEYILRAKGGYNQHDAISKLSAVLFGDD